MVLAAFGITVGGWWLWCVFLALAYTPGPSPYDVRGGLFTGYGRNLSWWTTLLVAVTVLMVMELGYRAVKRNLAIAGLWGRAAAPPREPAAKRRACGVGSITTALRRLLPFGARATQGVAGTTVAQRSRGNVDAFDVYDDDDAYDDEDEDESRRDGEDEIEMPADRMHVGLWQEIEKDPEVRARLELMNSGEDQWS